MEVKLRDLLEDGVYIKLKDEYRNKIFQKFLKKFKNKKLASEFLNLSGSHYINAYQNNKFDCPLLVLYKIAKYIKEDIKNIEKNIELIKMPKHGKHIKNPKFPFTINKELAKILGNLVGDGCITYHKNSLRVYYTNKDKLLRKLFKKAINEYFGEVDIWGNLILYLPQIVGKILLKFVNKKELKSKIPTVILKSNISLQCEFLRALFEDDGSASCCYGSYKGKSRIKRNITLTAGQLNLLNQVKDILTKLDIKAPIVISKNNCPHLQIFDRESFIRFKKFIGFSEGYYKQVSLDKIIKSYKRFIGRQGIHKNKIINFLRQKGYSKTDEISKELNLTQRNTYEHLKHLRKFGIITSKANKLIRNLNGQIKNNPCYSWSIN